MGKKRNVRVAVVSDVHLGTYGCRAKELVQYLKSIKPEILVLNGDIIDMWQFSKRYWPRSHMKVVKHIINLLSKGTRVYYVTGNHDELLRKFVGFELGSLEIVNKIVLELDGKKAWIFHGDVFDVTMQHSKWLAKLGAIGYDTLIVINAVVNFLSEKLGRGRVSFSKKIKNSVKGAVKFVNAFEETAADIAISNGYDYVVCGHIHTPEIRTVAMNNGEVMYLNSGDWIESLSALEYHDGSWRLYKYTEDKEMRLVKSEDDDEEVDEELNTKALFNNMLKEFKIKKT